MPETGFTSLRSLNTSGERDPVLGKLSPNDAALAEAYFGQADEDKEAHWSEGIDQGGDEWNAEFEDRTTSIHMFGGMGAKAPTSGERESKPHEGGETRAEGEMGRVTLRRLQQQLPDQERLERNTLEAGCADRCSLWGEALGESREAR